jgi:hypothetical protein
MPAVGVDGCIAFLQQSRGGVNPKRLQQVNARRKVSSSPQIQFMIRRTTCQKRATCPAALGAKRSFAHQNVLLRTFGESSREAAKQLGLQTIELRLRNRNSDKKTMKAFQLRTNLVPGSIAE